MARFARVVAVNTPHHITQRGNARQYILDGDAERLVYLRLLRQQSELHGLAILGYCLMSSHVHLIAVPRREDSLCLALKHTHGRYAAYFNARRASSGHVWQGRYYSCPLDEPHLWAALRYTELNPVRARMVADAAGYPWSSAGVHCGAAEGDGLLDMARWQSAWTAARWREYLAAADADEEASRIRSNTHTGRPLGCEAFVNELELALHRRLAPLPGGRPRKERPDGRQAELAFDTT